MKLQLNFLCLWQASHISHAAPAGVSRGEGWRAFFGAVGTLALLDLAGDATQILTVVFVAQYSDALLVFLAACVGLTSAAAAEAALGRVLKAALSPRTLSYLSAALLIVIGGALVLLSVA